MKYAPDHGSAGTDIRYLRIQNKYKWLTNEGPERNRINIYTKQNKTRKKLKRSEAAYAPHWQEKPNANSKRRCVWSSVGAQNRQARSEVRKSEKSACQRHAHCCGASSSDANALKVALLCNENRSKLFSLFLSIRISVNLFSCRAIQAKHFHHKLTSAALTEARQLPKLQHVFNFAHFRALAAP